MAPPLTTFLMTWTLVSDDGIVVLEQARRDATAVTLACAAPSEQGAACSRKVPNPRWSLTGGAWVLSDATGAEVAVVRWVTSTTADVSIGVTDRAAHLSFPTASGLARTAPEAPLGVAGWTWDGTTMRRDGGIQPGLWSEALLNCQAAPTARYFSPVLDTPMRVKVPVEVPSGAGTRPTAALSVDIRPCAHLDGAPLGVITDEKEFYRSVRAAQ